MKNTTIAIDLAKSVFEIGISRRPGQTEPPRDVKRAEVLWQYHHGATVAVIMKSVGMTRKSVTKWIRKALNTGVSEGLRDTPHGSAPKLTDQAKAWVTHVACTKPKDLGMAAEVWSRQALADYVRRHSAAEGHPSLLIVSEGFQGDRTPNSEIAATSTRESDLLPGAE